MLGYHVTSLSKVFINAPEQWVSYGNVCDSHININEFIMGNTVAVTGAVYSDGAL